MKWEGHESERVRNQKIMNGKGMGNEIGKDARERRN